MPNALVKSFAKKTNNSVDKVESLWKNAVKIAKEQGHAEEYDYIVGVLKQSLKMEALIETANLLTKSKAPTPLEKLATKEIAKKYDKDHEILKIEKARKGSGHLVTFQISSGSVLRKRLLNKNLVNEAKQKEYELFLGRFQPLHKGHAAVIGKMKNPIIALVKGGKSGSDKTKNPLSLKDQARLIKKAYSNAIVIEVKNGYIPDIAEELLKRNMKITAVWAGEDRRAGYERQLSSYDKKNPDKAQNIKFKPTFVGGKRIGGTSATIVRQAIRDDDKATFLKHMSKKLHSEWDFLRKKIT